MKARIDLEGISKVHHFASKGVKSVNYRLTPVGFEVSGSIWKPVGLSTVRKIWKDYKSEITQWSDHFGVPAEIIITTIATESAGNRTALRKEPGYKSDASTPNRISPGLMQTLISTAQSMMKGVTVTRDWLFDASNSIQAGTAYIAHQSKKTGMDPPLVLAAYNAGAVYLQTGSGNRWKTRQYPIGTGKHVDRAMGYFNACFAMWGTDGGAPKTSFVRMLDGPIAGEDSIVDEPPTDEPTETNTGIWTMFSKLLNIGGIGGLGALLGNCQQVSDNAPSSDTMLPILLMVVLALVNGGSIQDVLGNLFAKKDDTASS